MCCLPCPATDWVYPESKVFAPVTSTYHADKLPGFNTYNRVAEWLSVLGLVLMSWMLISYAVLPLQKTRSHYLSICLCVALILLSVCLAYDTHYKSADHSSLVSSFR